MKRIKILEIFFISIVLISIVPVFAEENDTDTATSFHQAILRGQIVKIRSLLESGVDINIRDKQERTPLHTAIDKKKNQIVKLLLEKNADVNLIDNMGDTPMHLAVKTGQLKVVELLIEKGADVNAVDAQSNSPLSMAQKAGQKQIADLLIKHGAKETKLDEEASFDRNRITGREQSLENMESQFQRQPDTTQEEEEPEIDILADPNEIRARIKTYEGLEKSIEEVASKSRIGIRHWQKITEDNRVALVRVVKNQKE